MRVREWQLQYEGLHDLCFTCGRYGHRESNCLSNVNKVTPYESNGGMNRDDGDGSKRNDWSISGATPFGPWSVVQRNGRRATRRTAKGMNGIPTLPTLNASFDADRGWRLRPRGQQNRGGSNQDHQTPGHNQRGRDLRHWKIKRSNQLSRMKLLKAGFGEGRS